MALVVGFLRRGMRAGLSDDGANGGSGSFSGCAPHGNHFHIACSTTTNRDCYIRANGHSDSFAKRNNHADSHTNQCPASEYSNHGTACHCDHRHAPSAAAHGDSRTTAGLSRLPGVVRVARTWQGRITR